ncbi:MAG: alpha/beta hydrolase [Candidatus Nanoarchaeia archaeon]|nr:alpha/beta hydrolase [Candidatus Nanoarchaeia archaeon]
MKFENKTYSDAGIKMKYITAGNGKPFLFIHGVLADANAYKGILKLFADKYKVIAVDLPCFGKSGTPKAAWDFRDFAAFLNKFISSLKIKNLIVMGHSFGGGIAFCMAAENKTIEKLVLVNSAGAPEKYAKLELAFLSSLAKETKEMVKEKKQGLIRTIAREYRNSIAAHLPKIGIVIKTVKKSLQADYGDELKKITAKTLILLSNKDEIFRRDSADYFKKSINNSKVILADGGHSWLLLEPRKFYGAVSEWLKD